MKLLGRVEKGVVVFQNGASTAPIPDGTLVEVTPVDFEPIQVSKERQEALRQLIGFWKTEHPPSDEEVERIVDEERMKKYG